MAVEKGTKAVISVNFSAHGERTFNNLRANFAGEIPRKEFFNSHACLRQQSTFLSDQRVFRLDGWFLGTVIRKESLSSHPSW